MIKRMIVLTAMIGFDTFLHAQDVFFGSGTSNWFWFDTMRMYDCFWFTYWGIAMLITLSMGTGWLIRKRKVNELMRG